jgi:hypothetical protein
MSAGQSWRPSERVAAAFFLYATGCSLLLPVAAGVRLRMALVNAAVLALLAWAARRPGGRWVEAVRGWAPVPLILLAYKEMGWLAQPHASFDLENAWVEWDRLILRDWGWQAALESLGPAVPGFLEFCYLMVYLMIPVSIGIVRFYRPENLERHAFPLVLTCLITYGLFPYFPSEPPRTVFPGELFPVHDTWFRRINWWICEGYGIHTSVFPSGHVSSAIASAVGVLRSAPEARWSGRILCVLAAGIFAATIHGRYHYAVDSVAGAAVAVAVLALTRRGGSSNKQRAAAPRP